jgi:tetratricopeptide (TPR) repeat protein
LAAFAERLLALDRASGEAASLLAEVRLRQGDLEGAARESAAILARHPDHTRALQVHAVSHAEIGNRNLARESFEKLLARNAEDWGSWNNLARLELSSGNTERAAELFERAVDLNSRNLEGYRGLEQAAEAARDTARLERARAMIRFLSK